MTIDKLPENTWFNGHNMADKLNEIIDVVNRLEESVEKVMKLTAIDWHRLHKEFAKKYDTPKPEGQCEHKWVWKYIKKGKHLMPETEVCEICGKGKE